MSPLWVVCGQMAVDLNMTAYIYIARLRRTGIQWAHQWASVATAQSIIATSPTGRMKQHGITNKKNAKSTYDYFKRMPWLTTYKILDAENNVNF